MFGFFYDSVKKKIATSINAWINLQGGESYTIINGYYFDIILNLERNPYICYKIC